MKKAFLLTAALAATCSAFAAIPQIERATKQVFNLGPEAHATIQAPETRAPETFMFTYSEAVYSATMLNNATPGTTRVYLGFMLTTDDIKGLAGDKVTGFTVVSPSNQNMNLNTITDARFFYSLDFTKEDYSQDFNLSKEAFAVNNIDIDTPYTITGEEETIVFGYSFVVPKANNMYYLPYDGVSNPYIGSGIYAATDKDEFPQDFYTFAGDLGALSMAITLEGENFPNYVSFTSVPYEIYLPLGEKSSATVTLAATTPNPIESVEFEYTFGGEKYTSEYVLPEALNAGAARTFYAPIDFPAQSEKLNEKVTFNITKLNGEPNVSDGATVDINVAVLSEVPVRQTLFEEYTGTWCGYCTRGFAALEYIREKYPEFVVAAFHSGQGASSDPMQITNQFPSQVGGFPSAVLNRGSVVDPYFGTQEYMDMELPIVGDILALNSVATPWKISVDHAWESEDVLVAKAEVANMIGFTDRNYKIAYLLVADGLSGMTQSWVQSNYYNTEKPQFIPQLNAFCMGGEYGKSKVVGLVYNDVVISSTGIYGENGSIPTTMAAEETAEHSIKFDLSQIKSNLLPDKNKLRVIAAIVDANGNVLNCAKNEVNDFGAGVDGILDENAPVEYYNLNGQKVLNPDNGIFIRRQGSTATKVIR